MSIRGDAYASLSPSPSPLAIQIPFIRMLPVILISLLSCMARTTMAPPRFRSVAMVSLAVPRFCHGFVLSRISLNRIQQSSLPRRGRFEQPPQTTYRRRIDPFLVPAGRSTPRLCLRNHAAERNDDDNRDCESGSRSNDSSNAMEWFDAAGILVDPATFSIGEKGMNSVAACVYSVEGTIAGQEQEPQPSLSPVRIYWTTTTTTTQQPSDGGTTTTTTTTDQILTGFYDPVERCWIQIEPVTNGDEKSGDRCLHVTAPGDLARAVSRGSSGNRHEQQQQQQQQHPVLLLPFHQSGKGDDGEDDDASGSSDLPLRVNPLAIEESSLRKRSFYQWDGSTVDVFCATLVGTGERVWWRTVSEAHRRGDASTAAAAAEAAISEDPYDDVVYSMSSDNDEEWENFRRFSGGERGTLFGRDAVMRTRALANTIHRCSSGRGWAFNNNNNNNNNQDASASESTSASTSTSRLPHLARWILAVASTWVSVSLLRASLPGLTDRFGPTGMAQNLLYGATIGWIRNGPYLRAWSGVVAAFVGVSVLLGGGGVNNRQRQRRYLRLDDPLVQHLTTLSVGVSSLCGSLLATVDYAVLVLIKLPLVGLLRALSVVTTPPFQKVRRFWAATSDRIASWTLPGGGGPSLVGSTDRDNNGNNNNNSSSSSSSSRRALFLSGAVIAPLREELVFRWGFERAWRLGAWISSSCSSSSSMAPPSWTPPLPPWAVVSSLLFGVMHASNWLPVRREHASALNVNPNVNDNDNNANPNAWPSVVGAVFHSALAFVASVWLLTPLYLQRGLCASFGAHAAINALGSLLLLLTTTSTTTATATDGRAEEDRTDGWVR